MPQQDSFQQSFERLRSVLQAHASDLQVRTDEPGDYYVVAPYSEKFKKELFFGAVHLRKTYVSYHLMPVYMYPELIDGLSPELRTRMQGKSCFNFKAVNETMLHELARLTEACYDRFKSEGLA